MFNDGLVVLSKDSQSVLEFLLGLLSLTIFGDESKILFESVSWHVIILSHHEFFTGLTKIDGGQWGRDDFRSDDSSS